ncbi:MAG TPA: flavin reductase [Lichenihabitans sp.]|jgi:flavin reductase (DIM6/NTAB) family NADH-FMN oxidoreductase RutF|nr:flavin reductase [Lichenihabitans sp.]
MTIHHSAALALRDEPMEAMTRIGYAGSPDTGTAFRDAMRRVVTAVHVVTSDGAHGRAGMTASAVTSVSDRPPTVLVCLNGSSASAARLIKNGVFCINTLGPGDEEIAATFAGRTELPQHRRFERGRWGTLVTGAPMLETAIAGFDCRLTDVRRIATHDVLIGEVLAVFGSGDGTALAYLDRTYRTV